MNNYELKDWTNFGDISPEHGQLWVKGAHVDNTEDFAEVVEIRCATDFGGPDNVYIICGGSIYIPLDDETKMESALDCICVSPSQATWIDKMLGCEAYSGIDTDSMQIVSVGKVTDTDAMPHGWEVETQLHGNRSISKWLAKEYLI